MTRLDLLKAVLAAPDPADLPRRRFKQLYDGCTRKVQMVRPLKLAVRQFLIREAA